MMAEDDDDDDVLTINILCEWKIKNKKKKMEMNAALGTQLKTN